MNRLKVHQAPPHLSDRSKVLWKDLVPERAKSPGRLAMIRIALEDLDLHDKAREELTEAGLTFTTSTTRAVHMNPLLTVLAESHGRFLAAWKALGLVFDEVMDAEQ